MWIQDLIDINKSNKSLALPLIKAQFEIKEDNLIVKCNRKLENYIRLKEKTLLDEVKKKIGLDLRLKIEVLEDDEEDKNDGKDVATISPITGNIAQGKLLFHDSLNPDYTFDTFITGESNKLAMKYISNIVASSLKDSRFIYVWGNPGVGKTHLLQATVHDLLNKGLNVAYFEGKDFISFVVKTLSDSPGKEQIRREREILDADALCIDDIQFMQEKTKTQEELKYFIDHYIDAHKYLCIVSDRAPADLSNIIEALTSRLITGYVTDVAPPDSELKRALFMRELERNEVQIPEQIFELIVQTNIPSARHIILIANTLANIIKSGRKVTDVAIESVFKTVKIDLVSFDEYKVRSYIKNKGIAYSLEELQGKIPKTMIPIRNEIIISLIGDKIILKSAVARVFNITRSLISHIVKKQ